MAKKILIISESRDISTSKTIEWIQSSNIECLRINMDDNKFDILSIDTQKVNFKNSFGHFFLEKDDVVWFRRASSIRMYFFKSNNNQYSFEDEFKKFIALENNAIMNAFYNWLIMNCNCIGNPFYSHPCKIDVLLKAEKTNIKTPNWIITNNKQELLEFSKKHKQIVQKNFEHFTFFDESKTYKNLVKLVSKTKISNFEFKHGPAFFQEYIEKKYEIRSFFFKEAFFSMGIFSQSDKKTRVDFRNYNVTNPNRNIPLDISQDYTNKLLNLSKQLNIDHGSYDIVVDENNNYFLLEINPVGQFGMVSYPCNYNIEKFIAENLIKIANL